MIHFVEIIFSFSPPVLGKFRKATINGKRRHKRGYSNSIFTIALKKYQKLAYPGVYTSYDKNVLVCHAIACPKTTRTVSELGARKKRFSLQNIGGIRFSPRHAMKL